MHNGFVAPRAGHLEEALDCLQKALAIEQRVATEKEQVGVQAQPEQGHGTQEGQARGTAPGALELISGRRD